jgi:hypothetical protein
LAGFFDRLDTLRVHFQVTAAIRPGVAALRHCRQET